MSDGPTPRVVIIGGGVAGLTAAGRLTEAGIDAVIVEGRSRLGGRIHTIDADGSDAAWIDMGAAWIDDHKTNRVFHTLDAAGVGVAPTWPGLTDVRTFDERTGTWLGRYRSMLAMLKFGWRYHRLRKQTTDFANLGERIAAVLGPRPNLTDEFLLKTTAELLDGGRVDARGGPDRQAQPPALVVEPHPRPVRREPVAPDGLPRQHLAELVRRQIPKHDIRLLLVLHAQQHPLPVR